MHERFPKFFFEWKKCLLIFGLNCYKIIMYHSTFYKLEKGKPIARWGRKVMGLPAVGRPPGCRR